MSEFSYLEAFVVKTLLFDLKQLIKYNQLQPVTGWTRGRWDFSYLTGDGEERRKERGKTREEKRENEKRRRNHHEGT